MRHNPNDMKFGGFVVQEVMSAMKKRNTEKGFHILML
uniref:Uncharacterized protein n=1 Tax=Arundo donax TaxID=35708 RepID=A0A0A9HRY8_ARUDO